MPRKPYAGSSLAKFVTKRVLELRPKKSQVEIAAEAGYINSNVISMLKNGSSKLALDRVPALARALETDPALLFKLACEQEGGETLRRTVEEIFGLAITRNEIGWIQAIREASDHSDPSMTNRLRSAIFGLFGR